LSLIKSVGGFLATIAQSRQWSWNPRKLFRLLGQGVKLLLVTTVIVWILRSVLFAPYYVPSGSMMPTLRVGDFLVASRWDYGISPRSFFAWGATHPRLGGSLPERGDMVIFAAPGHANSNVIKRVVGLPGDRIRIDAGQLFLNGQPTQKVEIGDFILPRSPGFSCLVLPGIVDQSIALSDGSDGCRFDRIVETLPGGATFPILNIALARSDFIPEIVVPEDHLFVMGDNRDDSMDSRVPISAGGVGLLPTDHLMGKVRLVIGSDLKGHRFLGERALAAD